MQQGKNVGILGGGQLGRMTAEAANAMNIPVSVLDAADNPASRATNAIPHITGDFKNMNDIMVLAKSCRTLTVEIEHVDADALETARDEVGVNVQPSPETIRIIQDKCRQKEHLAAHGVPLPEFCDVSTGGNTAADVVEAVLQVGRRFGYPMMLKTKKLAYDGRGNRVISSASDVAASVAHLGGGGVGKPELYVEKWVPYEREVAVMVARGLDGTVLSYQCVETIQRENVCHVVIAPAQIEARLVDKARSVAEAAIKTFDGAGVYGVEMFLLSTGEVLLNEIAPRPHNSGHYTMEACHTSQFEQHLRAILGLPLGSTDMKVPAAIMINILGTSASMNDTMQPNDVALGIAGASVHLYGKAECRAGRKMGHVTIVGDNMEEVVAKARQILAVMPGGADSAGAMKPLTSPLVGIIMGSDSDLPIMKAAASVLKEFDVPFELTIVSAHRTPHRMVQYAESARSRGLKVIIAAAGGAAHLPGMVAALTPLPVIGVPVALKQLDGVDSLHSIVQMPRGVPVATVAINNSTNAALLAIRILGTLRPEYHEKMLRFQRNSEEEVLGKVDQLKKVGWENY